MIFHVKNYNLCLILKFFNYEKVILCFMFIDFVNGYFMFVL